MPTRIVRDGILTSERVNALSGNAELFYRRLMSVADDHGRYSANPTQLRAYCYPLKLDSVKEDSIKKHLAECVDAGLIVLYTVAGKAYLQMLDFGQRINGKSRFPEPPTDIPGESRGIPGDSRLGVDGGVVEDEDGSGPEPALPAPAPAITLPLVDKSEFPITSAQVAEFRELYPAVDVMAQLREMRGWCIGNPTKRKTKGGILRFVTSWLAKEQDKGGSPAGYTPAGAARIPVGGSPKKTETPESKLEDARLLAERMVDLGQWTPEQGRQHIQKFQGASA